MKLLHILACLALFASVAGVNIFLTPIDAHAFGGLTWVGWLSVVFAGFFLGLLIVLTDSTRLRSFFRTGDDRSSSPLNVRKLTADELAELGLDKYRGPAYPHPVIFPERCIGCQACVDACPHDVLAIVDGTASAVAPDLCMEDTACQAECPVNPKACIVINTAKDVRSLPTPTRDGATFQTNVPGCFLIGDVSGVPLIKNAVKEGAEVIAHISRELASLPTEPRAEYDVAIIGIGPGGASAAAEASQSGLKYVGIEQDKILSTIELYPKGKYIFFKPDTKDWVGGISVAGLGLAKPKYGGVESDENAAVLAALGAECGLLVHQTAAPIHAALLSRIPTSLRPDIDSTLREKIEKELKKRIADFLRSKSSQNQDWTELFRSQFLTNRDSLLRDFSLSVVDQLQTKIAGDQRENILSVWHGNLADKGVRINEQEACKAVTKAEDGDYFLINTERGNEKQPQTYTARRVVIAIGLRGAPNKLRLPNEDLRVMIDGREQQKVFYGLSNPMDFKNKNIVVVGGGNVAVEAAVDLVATREGNSIRLRGPDSINSVTMLVRDYLAPTVKFGNKLQLYNCSDERIIDLKFGAGIREMREHEVVIENVRTKEVVATIPNDFVFALIGGERPNRFLESIGITIK